MEDGETSISHEKGQVMLIDFWLHGAHHARDLWHTTKRCSKNMEKSGEERSESWDSQLMAMLPRLSHTLKIRRGLLSSTTTSEMVSAPPTKNMASQVFHTWPSSMRTERSSLRDTLLIARIL